MTEFSEMLFTPKELDKKKILSRVQQWKERERGRLKCYRIGRKSIWQPASRGLLRVVRKQRQKRRRRTNIRQPCLEERR